MLSSLVMTLSLLLSFASAATATQVGTIQGQLRMPDDTPVNNTRIMLNNGDRSTYSRSDGTFALYGVPPGVHLLDVYSPDYLFSQVKVQLLPDSMDKPNCIEYAFPGAAKQAIFHPLILKAHAKYEYFEKKAGFNVLSIIANPMVLLMLVSVGMMVAMPYMMENLEPEERERMKKQMEMQKDPSKMFSQMLGDLTGANEEQALPPTPKKERKGKK